MRRSFRVVCTAIVWFAAIALVPGIARAQGNLSLDRDRMKDILNVVSKEIEKSYFDPQLKGLDWKGLTAQAKERIDKAASVSDMLTAIFALVDKLQDSHTVFLPPGRVARIKFGFNAKAYGDEIRVYEVKKNSAADVAGLQPGDRITLVNGFRVERESWQKMMLYFRQLQPVARMDLQIVRGDQPPQKISVDAKVDQGQLVRDVTEIDTVYQLIREEQSDRGDDDKYHYSVRDDGVGYVEFREFPNNMEFLDNLVGKIRNSKATIVDLRGNPGGAINTLASTLGHFETEATALMDMIGRKKTETVTVKPRQPRLDGPMFILVDSETASAGEIFARHFQKSGRAKVIGDQTSGRVLAAHLVSEHWGVDYAVFYGIEISFARVVFPGGEELEKRGVTPDIKCLPSGEQLHQKQDVCRALAYSLARKALGLPEETEKKIAINSSQPDH
jgi:carboxyl-terminal processing protease